MPRKRKSVEKASDKSRFVWGEEDGDIPFEIIRYDEEARNDMIAALLAESREIAQGS